MWADFKKFILRGNVMDLAVGVVMGTAFSAIVNSIVNDIIMPIIGFITAGIDFKDLEFVLTQAVLEGDAVIQPKVSITYGNLIQAVLQFVIIAICIFLVVKGINTLRERLEKKKEEAPAAPAAKPADVALLEEIRDLLQDKKA